MSAKLRACLTRCTKCDDTKRVVAQDDIEAGNPVEFVSETNGVVTVKKLADATKVYGVAWYDMKANDTGDIVYNNTILVKSIVMPTGLLKKDLQVDRTNNPNLELDREA